MDKVLYTDFVDIDNVISSMMDSPLLKKAITKVNLYKFWDSILPEKLKSKSKPYGMLPGGIMIIACQNPVVAQELSLYKVMILKKFQTYAKTLNIKLSDFKFDSKKWNLVNDID